MLSRLKQIVVILGLSLLSSSAFAALSKAQSRTWKKEVPKSLKVVEGRFIQGSLDIGDNECEAYFKKLHELIYDQFDQRDRIYYLGVAGCGRNTPDYSIEVFVVREEDRPILDELESVIKKIDLWGHRPVMRKISGVIFDITIQGSLHGNGVNSKSGYAYVIKRFKSYSDFNNYFYNSLITNVRNSSLGDFMNWLIEQVGLEQAEVFKRSLSSIDTIHVGGAVSLITPDNDAFLLTSKRGTSRDCSNSPSARCDQ